MDKYNSFYVDKTYIKVNGENINKKNQKEIIIDIIKILMISEDFNVE